MFVRTLVDKFFQNKNAESPITRIFGGRFRSTLKAPHQRDSQTVEDWRSIRLDIQVRGSTYYVLSILMVYIAGASAHDKGCAPVHLTSTLR